MSNQVSISQLKAFSPLDGLKSDNLNALVKKTKIRTAEPGRALFTEGDSEKRTIYILVGTVDLREGDEMVATIKGGTDEARNPVAPMLPRRYAAIARDEVQYISIDSDLLDVMLTWDQTGSYEVSELQGRQRTVATTG